MLTDGTWYNDPTCLSSRSPLYLSYSSSSPFHSFSPFPHPLIHSPSSIPLSRIESFSLSPFVYIPLVLSLPALSVLCTPLYGFHLPTARTIPRTKSKQCCQTSVRRAALAICISFVSRHRIFRERVLSGDFRVLLSAAERQASTLFA